MVRFTEMYEEEKTGREGIGAESIERDMVAHFPESLCRCVRAKERSQKNAAAFQFGNKSKGLFSLLGICCAVLLRSC